jgi:hypothetical protein
MTHVKGFFHPVWLIIVTIVFCIILASQRKTGQLLYTFPILYSVLLTFRILDLPSPENTTALDFFYGPNQKFDFWYIRVPSALYQKSVGIPSFLLFLLLFIFLAITCFNNQGHRILQIYPDPPLILPLFTPFVYFSISLSGSLGTISNYRVSLGKLSEKNIDKTFPFPFYKRFFSFYKNFY